MTIALPLQLGEPVTHRGITILPVFPLENPAAAYTTLEDALPRGFRIAETSDAGSVPELVVENPLDEHVLLYDGEELIGAKQNRILNLSVLVAAGSRTAIPVSCVEVGRWHRRSATFAAAGHTAGPELRHAEGGRAGVERAGPRRRPVRRVGRDRGQVAPPRRALADRRALGPLRGAEGRDARAGGGVRRPARPVRDGARPPRRARLPRLPLAARRVRPPPPQAAGRLHARRDRAARPAGRGDGPGRRAGRRRVGRRGRRGSRRPRWAPTCGSRRPA